jgi:hypothetical protein
VVDHGYTGPVLTDSERERARQIFEAHGYGQPLRIARVTSEEERVFLVPPSALVTLPERTLVTELVAALGRKVYLRAEGTEWGASEPLH